MSLDVDAVVKALFDAGAGSVTVKDFHRTGYNLLPELIDRRARIVSGYLEGPVPGIGDPAGAELLLCIGMHASSGSGGFLAHTLTSRIARLEVNGRLFPEIALFASSLAPYGIRPVFFSGCPVACEEASAVVPGISTFAMDKSAGQGGIDAAAWREVLAGAAAASLANRKTAPCMPEGPFSARVVMRDGEAVAAKLARRWGLRREHDTVLIESPDIHELYRALVRLCYLTRFTERIIPAALPLYSLWGRAGRAWVRRRIRKESKDATWPAEEASPC